MNDTKHQPKKQEGQHHQQQVNDSDRMPNRPVEPQNPKKGQQSQQNEEREKKTGSDRR